MFYIYIFLPISYVGRSSPMVTVLFCMLRVLRSNLAWPSHYFLNIFLCFLWTFAVGGSIPLQNWQFFRSLPQPWDLPFPILFFEFYIPYKWQVPESTGTRFKIEKTQLLFNKKIEKCHLFKTPSFNFDDIFLESWPQG